MAIKLKKAFSAYDRLDVTDVDCGNGWICQIKSFGSVARLAAKEQARIRAAGGVKKKAAPTATVDLAGVQTQIIDDESWIFGSYELDLEFFVDNVLVGWHGLLDDDNSEVEYSKQIATEIFTGNGEPAKQLYRELLAASLDAKLYIKPSSIQAEEDGGN